MGPEGLSRALRRAAMGVLCCALIGLVACGGDSGAARPKPQVSHADSPFQIVTTSPVFADLARSIGGENVNVVSLVPPGANPHTYQPTPDQADVVGKADIILVNGGGLENANLIGFLQDHRRESNPALFVTFANNVPSPSKTQPPGKPIFAAEAGDNPHLWLDPMLARVYPETIADSLTIIDGVNKAFYQTNFETYRQGLQDLDKEISGKLNGIAADRRKIVTYHDSFVHFARRYGLQIIGVATQDPATPPDQSATSALAEKIRENGVPAAFAEVGFDASGIREAAAQSSVKACTLYTDTLDDHVTSYMDMMRSDEAEVARCLGSQ